LPVAVSISAMFFTAVPLTVVNLPPIYASAQLPFANAIVFTTSLPFSVVPYVPTTLGAQLVTAYMVPPHCTTSRICSV